MWLLPPHLPGGSNLADWKMQTFPSRKEKLKEVNEDNFTTANKT